MKFSTVVFAVLAATIALMCIVAAIAKGGGQYLVEGFLIGALGGLFLTALGQKDWLPAAGLILVVLGIWRWLINAPLQETALDRVITVVAAVICLAIGILLGIIFGSPRRRQ